MTLLETYIEKNKNKEWFERYSGTGKKNSGKFFAYTNTNFRTQKAFIDQFQKFLSVENKPKEDWEVQPDYNQNLDKQRVVNLTQSKLFKKTTENLYVRTVKGLLYDKFIKIAFEDDYFSQDERWFLNYLFLLNGYYDNSKNYILNRTQELVNYFFSTGEISSKLLISEANLIIQKESFEEAVKTDFFFMHSFYDDNDFLIKYLRSDSQQKNDLWHYVIKNRLDKNPICCLSQKYKTGGSFDRGMIIDETKVFLLTFLLIKAENKNSDNILRILSSGFNKYISDTNLESADSFILLNGNIFNPIFEDILGLDDVTRGISSEMEMEDDGNVPASADNPEEYLDETSELGKQEIKRVFSLRKKQAKIESKYECILETTNNCKPIYFTAKATNKNYLEVHHFIPQEFRNDFSYSIEVLANYITLCPRCHRQIHLAVDNERKTLINTLFNLRKERLKQVGLDIEMSTVYQYYKVDN